MPEGNGCGVHEIVGDGGGVDPADLGVLAGFAVFGFAGPFVGGEDDGEEAVGGFDAPGAVDDVGDLEGLRLHREAGLLVELADGGLGDGLARLTLADGEVPHALGELGVLAALEEDDAVGGLVVDDDRGDQQGHRFERRLEGLRLIVGLLSHGVPFVGRIVGHVRRGPHGCGGRDRRHQERGGAGRPRGWSGSR